MTITQMRYYKTVCQYMSLTKASKVLHVSQPALSMAMKELESSCGVALFHHYANSLAITEIGMVLLDEVTAIIDLYDHLENMLTEHTLDKKYVRVGFTSLNGRSEIFTTISEFRRQYPDIQLVFTEDSLQQHYRALDSGRVDVIIAEKKPDLSIEEWNESALYRHKKLGKISMSFAVSAEHPLAKKDMVTWQEIAQQPLVLLDRSNQFTQAVQRELEAQSRQSDKEIFYTKQISTVEQFVENRVACGFLPTEVIEANPRIHGLSCPQLIDEWLYLVYRKDHRTSLSTRQFIQTAIDTFALQASA